ncbi:hypothetical protein PFISCL1PPCAC_26109, partial [Pristionchus fissidentatus]
DVSSTSTAPYSNRPRRFSAAFTSSSSTSLRTAHAEHSAPLSTRSRIETSSSAGTTSLERRACRICQSETGEMVRPCGCAGTMGDIHDTCLSKWVATSQNPNTCEICKETYAKSGSTYRPLKEWTKPVLETTDLLSLIIFCMMIYSLCYLASLFQERMFFERFRDGLHMRADDVGRITLVFVFTFMTMSLLSKYFRLAKVYVHRQKCIRFIDKGRSE